MTSGRFKDAPAEADGWGRQGDQCFWWRKPVGQEVAAVRIGEAPNIYPEDTHKNMHVSRDFDPQNSSFNPSNKQAVK